MNARLLSKLEYPYREMLESLKDVRGYDEFVEFIRPRVRKNNDWKAEVLALFEINKARHPLIEICSQESSTPEGVFKVSNGLGIIEAARIGYLFDTNFEKQERINEIEDSVKSIIKLRRGRHSAHNVKIEIDNMDEPISDTQFENARNAVARLLKEERLPPMSVITEIGRISV